MLSFSVVCHSFGVRLFQWSMAVLLILSVMSVVFSLFWVVV